MNDYTVIIPAYNAEKYIQAAINSALCQTFKPLEIIVIDDFSDDNTYDIVQKIAQDNLTVRLYKNDQNLNVATTRNKGLKLATGEFIAFLDADDIWVKEKMEKQIQFMQDNHLDYSYTDYGFIDKEGKKLDKIYKTTKISSVTALLKENYIGLATSVITKKIGKSFSMNPNYGHEDYIFWLDIAKAENKGGGINQPLAFYRVHGQGRSNDKKLAAINRWAVYRDYLKLNTFKSAYYFICYAFRAVKKHK